MRRLFSEAFGYMAASVVALGVDLMVLAGLVQWLAIPAIAAACISFCAGLLVSYVLSVTWVFQHHRIKTRHLEFAGFAALGAIGLGVNTFVMYVSISSWALHYLHAKCIAAVFTFGCNFLLRRQLLFVPRASPRG